MAKLVLLIIKFLTNFQNIGAEWDLGKQVIHIPSHFLGKKTKAWRGYYLNHSQSKDLRLFSQLKEMFSDCRSYKWLCRLKSRQLEMFSLLEKIRIALM